MKNQKIPLERCCLCGCALVDFGHNPRPLAEGRCCTECNGAKVIPARIAPVYGGKFLSKKSEKPQKAQNPKRKEKK
jgi:hypothetical protein